MKAKKSLIITLFAAVMAFALGATMVFAAATPEFTDHNAKVKIGDDTFDTIRTAENFESDGLVKATIDLEGQSEGVIVELAQSMGYTGSDGLGATAFVKDKATVTYYDLASAKVDLPKTMTQDEMKAIYDAENDAWTAAPKLILSVPSYVENYNSIKTQKFEIATDAPDASGWTFKVDTPAGFEFGLTTPQNFTLNTKVSRTTKTGSIKIDGAVPAAAVTVKARTQTAADVVFYKDEIKTENKVEKEGAVKFAYDGAAHKLVNNEVAGYSVAYSVLNTSTGEYDAVAECPSVTNVKDEVSVKATIKDSYPSTDTRHKADVEKVFTLGIEAAKKPHFTFDKDGVVGPYEYAVEGAEYDAYGYVVAVEGENTDAAKAAVKANEATLAEYFKDYYEITAETTKADPNTFEFKAEPKKLTDAEKKELAKKYEDLGKNFGFDPKTTVLSFTMPSGEVATLHTNSTNLIPEIEFVDSPTAVKFKAKKLKKKAASFTVTAVATNNQPVSYKLINAPQKITIDSATGQITLAKKLKKGTYKIRVKAYLPTQYKLYDGATQTTIYRQISETHDIKVKVKK